MMDLCLSYNLLNCPEIQSKKSNLKSKYDLPVLELLHLKCPFEEDQQLHARTMPFFNFQDDIN